MEPLFDLPIALRRGSRLLLHDLQAQLRAAILDGRLKPGLKLPATRALAETLQISRNTAVAAYDLLLSEGYLVGRPGAGTYVAEALPQPARPRPPELAPASDRRLAPFWREAAAMERRAADPTLRHDFRMGLPDLARLPFAVWRRLAARAMRAQSKAPVGYGESEGRLALREAIATHVSFARAVACQAEDIVVTAGAQQAFDLLARILVVPGRTVVAVEEPGYPPLRRAFAAAGASVIGVPVDGEGLIIERLPAEARIICVTPAHQFPLGSVLSQRRRLALLELARARGAAVIEDDYDGEFRFGGRPLDALQTLDRADSVFFVGTFSKSLFPALRLGFVVAPAWARRALVAARQLSGWHSTLPAQDTLAAFIQEGHLARHIRKMRKVYGQRREALLEALTRHCAERLEPIASQAGLHLAAWLAPGIRLDGLLRRARELGIGVEGLDRFATGPIRPGLSFGYGMIEAAKIEEGVRGLAKAMG